SPDQSRRSTATSSTCMSAMSGLPYLIRRRLLRLALQLLAVPIEVFEPTAEEERLLGDVVELAFGDLVERLEGLLHRHRRPRLAGELLGDEEVLRQEPLDAPRAADQLAVFLRKLGDTRDRD